MWAKNGPRPVKRDPEELGRTVLSLSLSPGPSAVEDSPELTVMKRAVMTQAVMMRAVLTKAVI